MMFGYYDLGWQDFSLQEKIRKGFNGYVGSHKQRQRSIKQKRKRK